MPGPSPSVWPSTFPLLEPEFDDLHAPSVALATEHPWYGTAAGCRVDEEYFYAPRRKRTTPSYR